MDSHHSITTNPSIFQLQALAAKELNSSLPLNDYNLPTGFYRIDLLPVQARYRGEQEREREELQGGGGVPQLPAPQLPAPTTSEPLPPLVDLESGKSTMEGTLPTEVLLGYVERERRRGELQLRERETTGRVIVADAPSFAFERRELLAAWVPLSYVEGFPTLPNGQPFWTKLEYELPEHHLALEAYLQLPTIQHQGVRQLAQLPEFLFGLTRASGGTKPALELGELQLLYHLYFWHYRVKAYDIYKVAAFRRQQEQRAIAVQDDHYLMSQEIMRRLKEYMESDEDFWEVLTPKAAIDLLKTLVAMQRISVGLPAGGPSTEKTGAVGLGQLGSLEMILRTVAQQQGSEKAIGSEEDKAVIIDKVLADPNMLTLAQELIVKINQGN